MIWYVTVCLLITAVSTVLAVLIGRTSDGG